MSHAPSNLRKRPARAGSGRERPARAGRRSGGVGGSETGRATRSGGVGERDGECRPARAGSAPGEPDRGGGTARLPLRETVEAGAHVLAEGRVTERQTRRGKQSFLLFR